MFCGFPVNVATLPKLAAVERASRYGTGASASWRVASSTTGASTRQTTSLTKNAESTPDATTTVPSSIRGVRARRSAHVITSRKKPESRRYAVTIIIANSSTSVGASTAATASAHGTAPETTITAAPMIATPVRSIRKPGTRPSAKPTYEATKAATAIARWSSVTAMGKAYLRTRERPDRIEIRAGQPRHGGGQGDGEQRDPRPGGDRRHGVHALRRALGQGRQRPAGRFHEGRARVRGDRALGRRCVLARHALFRPVRPHALAPAQDRLQAREPARELLRHGLRGVPQRVLCGRVGRLRHRDGRRRREAERLGHLRSSGRAGAGRRHARGPYRAGYVQPARARLRQEIRRRGLGAEGRDDADRLEESQERRPESPRAVPEGSAEGNDRL